MCLGEKLERKRERICLEKCSKIVQIRFFFCFFFFLNFFNLRGSRGIYINFVTL